MTSQHQSVGCPRREDLEFGSLLGEGAFARVVQVRDMRNSQEYALKMVDKKQIQATGRTASVMTERSLLSSFDHPGIVKLLFTFQDTWTLYFVLELVADGELASQIARMGTCPVEFAQFYTAEIVVVLTYLRVKRVVHRDLKPENMLLTSDGHLKLIDFDAALVVPDSHDGEGDAAGGCCQGQPKFAGTSFYLPPEVILNTTRLQDAFALDLWALGCILYQMLAGRTPFYASSEYVLFEEIIAANYTFAGNFPSGAVRELIEALLAPEPRDRLGVSGEGLTELKRHAFFGGSIVAFDRLVRRSPPYRVRRASVKDVTDLSQMQNSTASFDFASSAECTPEVGQGFLARTSMALTVMVSDNTDTDEAETGLVSMEQDGPVGRLPRQGTISLQMPPPRSSPQSLRRSSPTASAAASPNRTSSAYKTPDWRTVVNLPFASWQLWLSELVRREVLFRSEEVRICGSVVGRRFPCCKPKVLVLTNFPRLLVLDSKGLKLTQEIDISKSIQQASGSVVAVNSSVDFVLDAPKRRYWCSDVMLGADAWATEIAAALQQISQ
eukprot:TRINITY_DN12163_c0_g1_i1.p1 TRINITY_DN12163_c0_g1~~TRINITY_DN12163_c0_g1_i1.p1  ORF type:complete len:554 (+),score=101.83 TRINITY_DN12163_c0_g1_i1:224-1885(+)